MANGNFVAYYRTSTTKQTLGLESQQRIVHDYLNGGDWTLVGEHEEQESGKRHDNRPALKAAIAQCKATSSTLIIAKLDRLARNVAFIANLMEAGVDFVCCDMPNATRFTLHIYAAVAEEERRMISQRTKDGLAATKANGTKLGSGDPSKGSKKAAEERSKAAIDFAQRVMPMIEKVKSKGATSLRQIAEELNDRNVPTATGKGQWNAATVRAVMMRQA